VVEPRVKPPGGEETEIRYFSYEVYEGVTSTRVTLKRLNCELRILRHREPVDGFQNEGIYIHMQGRSEKRCGGCFLGSLLLKFLCFYNRKGCLCFYDRKGFIWGLNPEPAPNSAMHSKNYYVRA